jgi:glycosyltransferase involved in cell wall biosynthesis
MRRVFLYEPMLHGHRGVLLRYYCGALEKGGYTPVVCTRLLPEHESADLVDALEREAAAAKCDIIHVLTFERLGPRWLKYRRQLRRTGRPIVASYYLYDNLYGLLKGLPWDVLFGRRLLDRVLVSDDFLTERNLPSWRRQRINYVPDPWDPHDFPVIDRTEAKTTLRLPASRKVLMVFGALKPRKGLELLFDAVQQLGTGQEKWLLLLAGVLDPYFRTGPVAAVLAGLQAQGLIRIDDEFVDEAKVSTYFHAADFVVCPYPRTFQASSNVFTRACAAGTPAIVPDHGVMGMIARRHGAGLVFASDSAMDLARCLQDALTLQTGPRWQELVAAGYKLAAGKKLASFEAAVLSAYQQIRL